MTKENKNQNTNLEEGNQNNQETYENQTYIEQQEGENITNVEKMNIFRTIENNIQLIKENPLDLLKVFGWPVVILAIAVVTEFMYLAALIGVGIYAIVFIIGHKLFETDNQILKQLKVTIIFIMCLGLSYSFTK